MHATTATAFPRDGRRTIVYLFYDPRGHVDEYVPHKLRALRPHVDRILVVVNGDVDAAGRSRLAEVSDDVLIRPNEGFDVGGYRDAIEHISEVELEQVDELILMNYTWFGPVRPFEPVFARMDTQEVDFWGMTDHGEVRPHPLTGGELMHDHIQSHWIAVRRRMLQSEAWRDYWRTTPVIDSYEASIMHHEARFTQHFREEGFTAAVAFPHSDYPATLHPAADSVHLLMRDGCPVFKRRSLFHDPLYLDRQAIIGRWLMDAATAEGYPSEFILENLARNTAPKTLNTTASMLEILPEVDVSYDQAAPLRIAACVHLYYEDMADELLDALCTLPSAFDLYITTANEQKAGFIERRIADRADPLVSRSEVCVIPSNRGRDQSAFYVGMRDVLLSDDYDLVVKVHSKKTVQQGPTAGEFFKRQQLENLLHSPGYTANVVALFQREPGLGVVYAPTIHIGFPTLGGAWFGNQHRALEVCRELGVSVPLDQVSPLAPLGAMFIARPAALRRMADAGWTYDDYPEEEGYADGGLAHVQERIVSYVAAEDGFHTRTVANAEYAAISHTFLEYKLDLMSEAVQGYAIDEIRDVRRYVDLGRRVERAGGLGFLKEYVDSHHPRVSRGARPLYRGVRALYRMTVKRGKRPYPGTAAEQISES